MEVTRLNFNEALTKIEKTIKDATFISIDCEFTGLTTLKCINAFDTPNQYYTKVKTNSMDFLVIQYGLSIFQYDEEKDVFKQQSYSFYIFRKPVERNIPDQRFLCQSSSIDFLTQTGFDFNKLFKYGIPYLNITEEKKYRENLEERKNFKINQRQNGDHIVNVPDNAKSSVDDIINILNKFLETEDEEVQLPKSNSFIRRLIYQTVEGKYANKISLETRLMENKDRIMFAKKFKSKQDEIEVELKKHEEAVKEMEDFVGFTKVLRMVVNSEKLIVGHNFCLDMLHTIDKFLTPLPDDYLEFKEVCSSLFSKVVDTKYMASSEPFKELIQSSILKPLYDTVTTTPFESPNIEVNEVGYHINDNKEHEAGFDAFLTGVSFICMWKYLGKLNGLSNKDNFKDFSLLKSYINRIFLMILTDNQHINLAGEDLKPSRDHVFYLTFPKDWKQHNIVELFSPFGNVFIAWIDECSAYVGLYKKDQATVALSTLSQSDTYSIMTFAARQAMLEGKTFPSPNVSGKRRHLDTNSSSSKKTKTEFSFTSFFANTSDDSVVENENKTDDDSWKTVSKKGKRKAKRTFAESSMWE